MALTLQQFLDQLARSDLLTEADVQALIDTLPAEQRPIDGQQLARLLVQEKKLTTFQAQQIYEGKGDSLVLGNYLVLDKLGQGGMGVVFKAEHRRMERTVALKVLSPALTSPLAPCGWTPHAIQRFQREVKAAARLEHANIVTAYDADEASGVHFLVMQYVEGTDLATLVRQKGPLPVEKALFCILQAARGLAYAHARGVVHRDIKPANLLLDRSGVVKILDMGLARLESAGVAAGGPGGQDQDPLTATGQIMGTVDYMAPEQARDTKHADARADIYSLGVTLWHLLTGRAVYEGDTVVQKLMAHQVEPIPSLQEACPHVSSQLEAVFVKMIAKSPEARYPNMTEAIADLERCAGDRPPEHSAAGSGVDAAIASDEETRFNEFPRELHSSTRSALATSPLAPCGWPTTYPTAQNRTAAPTGLAPTVMMNSAQANAGAETEHSLSRSPDAQKQRTRRTRYWPARFRLSRIAWAGVAGATLFILCAAIVFYIRTKNGVIRVEINDPNIEVSIKGTEILLKQADQGKDVKLSPGDYTLIVERDEFKFETNKLVLKRGENVTVRVEMLRGEVQVRQDSQLIGHKKLAPPSLAIAPFDSAAAKKHQQAWARRLGESVEKKLDLTEEVNLRLVLIPPGEFLMGSTKEEIAGFVELAKAGGEGYTVTWIESEGPRHRVKIGKPFWLSRHEVTRGQFRQFVEETGYKSEAERDGQGGWGYIRGRWAQDPRFIWNVDPGYPQTDNEPVVNVSWNDAQAFCQWLSKKQSGLKFGLPTEAQWEYACRAGATTPWHCGDTAATLPEYAWYGVNSRGRTRPVAQLKPNVWGLYDTYGNVWEWCADWYAKDYYVKSPANDPPGPTGGSERVCRGGCWNDHQRFCRSAYRKVSPPPFRSHYLGFRVAAWEGS